MRKLLSLILIIIVFTSCLAKSTEKEVSGVFEGVGHGLLGDISVSVSIKKNKIIHIDVIEYSDTPGYSDTVFDYLPGKVIYENSTQVDSIAGATITSQAFLEAVDNALKKAGLK